MEPCPEWDDEEQYDQEGFKSSPWLRRLAKGLRSSVGGSESVTGVSSSTDLQEASRAKYSGRQVVLTQVRVCVSVTDHSKPQK
jgi:hypothetical protein